MMVDGVHHLVAHLVIVGFPFEQWCQRVTRMVDLMIWVIGLLRFPNKVVVMLVVYGKVPLVKFLLIEVMRFLIVELVEKVMMNHLKV